MNRREREIERDGILVKLLKEIETLKEMVGGLIEKQNSEGTEKGDKVQANKRGKKE